MNLYHPYGISHTIITKTAALDFENLKRNSAYLSDAAIHLKLDEIVNLDFERLKWKLAHSSEAKMSPELCDLAEREYRRFLTLHLLYPKAELVPSKLVDEFWHAHILDTAAYAEDCQKVFGKFMHHFPYFGIYGEDDQQNLNDSFDKAIQLYKETFGEEPPTIKEGKSSSTDRCHDCKSCASCRCKSCSSCRCQLSKSLKQAARCQGHSCHSPTSCACRSPGACK